MNLRTLFDKAPQYCMLVRLGTHVRVTRGDRWIFKSTDEYLKDYDERKGGRSFNRKKQLVRANEHREELRWAAKRDQFDFSAGCFFIAFMRHMPKSWKKGKRKPGKRDKMAWQPMVCKPDIDNYYKKTSDSLLTEDSSIWAAGILKFWVPDEVTEGIYFIRVPEVFDFVLQYLKEKLGGDAIS